VTADRELLLLAVPYGTEALVTDDHDDRLVYERFQRGAFRTATPASVRLLLHHKYPVGRVLALRETDWGLSVTVTLDPGPTGDELLRSAEVGHLGVSVGFNPLLDHYERGEAGAVKVRRAVRLGEVSLTHRPAYTGTKVRTRAEVERQRAEAWVWLNRQRRAVGLAPRPMPTRRSTPPPPQPARPAEVGRAGSDGLLFHHGGGRVLSVR
jgi:HK97 family phage prohead protease